jgi:hypothetical protein
LLVLNARAEVFDFKNRFAHKIIIVQHAALARH